MKRTKIENKELMEMSFDEIMNFANQIHELSKEVYLSPTETDWDLVSEVEEKNNWIYSCTDIEKFKKKILNYDKKVQYILKNFYVTVWRNALCKFSLYGYLINQNRKVSLNKSGTKLILGKNKYSIHVSKLPYYFIGNKEETIKQLYAEQNKEGRKKLDTNRIFLICDNSKPSIASNPEIYRKAIRNWVDSTDYIKQYTVNINGENYKVFSDVIYLEEDDNNE